MTDDTPSIHRMLRIKAAQHDLTLQELNAICQVAGGSPLDNLNEERARFVLNAIISKGDTTKAWAVEVARSL
jgi:hypothetical protein